MNGVIKDKTLNFVNLVGNGTFIQKLKRAYRTIGKYTIICEEYDNLDKDAGVPFDEFLIQLHVNHLLLQQVDWQLIRNNFPKEWLYVLDKYKYIKLHTALNLAIAHNQKIDSVRQNLKWESLADYSNSILPVRHQNGKQDISV